MPASTNINNMTVVHKSSGGMTTAFPDTCKTPTSGGPVPIPYPNTSRSADTANGSKTVKIDGNPVMLQGSSFATSTGDEAGSVGGVVSSTTKGKAEFVNYSFDVSIEGKSVPRLLDPMLANKSGSPNAPPAAEMQAPLVVMPAADIAAAIEQPHRLRVRFSYEKPTILRGANPLPVFEIPLELSGPETIQFVRSAYSATASLPALAGDYTLSFKGIDMQDQPLKD